MTSEATGQRRAVDPTAEITVVLVSWRSARDLAILLPNLRGKASRPERLRFSIVDNTGADPDLDALATDDVRVLRVDPGARRGSWGHAFALDRATEKIETGLALISDPDVHVLRAGWDELLAGELAARGALAIGAPYPWWKLGKYHDFPSPVFILFDVAGTRRLGVDWTPFASRIPHRAYNLVARQIVRLGFLATRRRLLVSPRLARAARRLEAAFGVVGPDTGYRLARTARRAGERAILFDEVTADDSRLAAAPAARALAADFELFFHDDHPMIVHRYSTRSWLWRTTRGGDVDHFRDCVQRLESTSPS